jgi:osmotically-inducible protein OsmY
MASLIVMLFSCLLTACIYSAASSSAQVIYNRHNIQKNLNDSYTSMQASHAIDTYGVIFKHTNITIATFNDSILVAGQVPNMKQKSEVEKIVEKMADNRKIYNYLEIANPSSALTRLSDSWITAKIKSRLIAINEVDPTQIKVVTENGTVYLMGIVPSEQAEIATDVAKETSGVQSVIKLFSYLQISKQEN